MLTFLGKVKSVDYFSVREVSCVIILSVDLGRVRTGLAICDPEEILASPIRVVMERNQDRLLDSIANEAAARHAERLVVGLPKIWMGRKEKAPKTRGTLLPGSQKGLALPAISRTKEVPP